MDTTLEAYLADHPAHHETVERWPIQGDLQVRLCLGTTLPPAPVSSSILAIVVTPDRQVLYLWPASPTGSLMHVLIGGRPEPGETLQQTIMREVGEETGWRVQPMRMIGFRHFHHLEPWVDGSDRPYPDFIQPIYAARAVRFDVGSIISEDLIPCAFMPVENVVRLTDAAQCPLLWAALAMRPLSDNQ